MSGNDDGKGMLLKADPIASAFRDEIKAALLQSQRHHNYKHLSKILPRKLPAQIHPFSKYCSYLKRLLKKLHDLSKISNYNQLSLLGSRRESFI